LVRLRQSPQNEPAGAIPQWIKTGKFLLMQETQILSKQEPQKMLLALLGQSGRRVRSAANVVLCDRPPG